jgi:hypothetical protein
VKEYKGKDDRVRETKEEAVTTKVEGRDVDVCFNI